MIPATWYVKDWNVASLLIATAVNVPSAFATTKENAKSPTKTAIPSVETESVARYRNVCAGLVRKKRFVWMMVRACVFQTAWIRIVERMDVVRNVGCVLKR
jgi:hypothetical protein